MIFLVQNNRERDLNRIALFMKDQSKVVKKRSLFFSLSVSLKCTLVEFNVCFFFSSIAPSLRVLFFPVLVSSLSLFLRRCPGAGWQKTEEREIISFSSSLVERVVIIVVLSKRRRKEEVSGVLVARFRDALVRGVFTPGDDFAHRDDLTRFAAVFNHRAFLPFFRFNRRAE